MKNKRKERKEFQSRERGNRRDGDLVPDDEKSPRKREKESADRSRGGQEAAGTRG